MPIKAKPTTKLPDDLDPVSFRSLTEMANSGDLDDLLKEYHKAVKNRKPKPMPAAPTPGTVLKEVDAVPKTAGPMVGIVKKPPPLVLLRNKSDQGTGAPAGSVSAPAPRAAGVPPSAGVPLSAGPAPQEGGAKSLPSRPSRPPGFGTDCLKVVFFSPFSFVFHFVLAPVQEFQ